MNDRIVENVPLAPAVYRLILAGDTKSLTAPGQFVQLRLPGFYLRRPISVCDWDKKSLTLIYKVVGQGTDALSRMKPGETLDALIGLGNGFDVTEADNYPLVIGGGVGAPPLYGLTKALLAAGKKPTVILGFNTEKEAFLLDEFRSLGVETILTTADGSAGLRGFVTDAMPEGAYVCACGPEPMLKAVHRLASGGQFSFEARMGCGFGACMGCSCQTVAGPKRICKEGPVLRREEILW